MSLDDLKRLTTWSVNYGDIDTLERIIESRRGEIINLFIEDDGSKKDSMPLIIAVKKGHFEAAKTILKLFTELKYEYVNRISRIRPAPFKQKLLAFSEVLDIIHNWKGSSLNLGSYYEMALLLLPQENDEVSLFRYNRELRELTNTIMSKMNLGKKKRGAGVLDPNVLEKKKLLYRKYELLNKHNSEKMDLLFKSIKENNLDDFKMILSSGLDFNNIKSSFFKKDNGKDNSKIRNLFISIFKRKRYDLFVALLNYSKGNDNRDEDESDLKDSFLTPIYEVLNEIKGSSNSTKKMREKFESFLNSSKQERRTDVFKATYEMQISLWGWSNNLIKEYLADNLLLTKEFQIYGNYS